jgi:hypothetical protein
MKTLYYRLLFCSILLGCLGTTAWAANAPATAPSSAQPQAPATAAINPQSIFSWSVGSAPTAMPAGANQPLLKVTESYQPAADEIRVRMTFRGIAGGGTYIIKKGTSALEALKLAGAEPYLTPAAKILISTRVEFDVTVYPPGNEANSVSNPAGNSTVETHGSEETVMVDVAAVRAGTAKDVIFREIKAKNYEIQIRVAYAEFHFSGGTPGDFVHAMEKHFGVDWSGVQIPPELSKVHIPEFRESHLQNLGIENDSGDVSLNEAHISDAEDVVGLYNAIADKYPTIGKWHLFGSPGMGGGDVYRPAAVMLLAPTPEIGEGKTPNLKVKALPLEGIPENRWASVKQAIEQAKDEANAALADANPPGERLDGKVSVQAESKTLVVVGTQGYIDLAESVLAADYKNEAVEHPAPRPTLGAASAKP